MSAETERRPGGWSTHVRVVAHAATPLPTLEIHSLARLDLFAAEQSVAMVDPVARSFATMATMPHGSLIVCTPATVAQTVWSLRVPVVIAAWGSAEWDVFGPWITRGIARIDVLKIARLAWPDAPTWDPVELAAWLWIEGLPWNDGTSAGWLLLKVEAVARLLKVVLETMGEDMVGLAAELQPPAVSTVVDATFEAMRGDPRLEALVRLSAEPMSPAGPIPGPQNDPAAWFAVSGEDLAWLAADKGGEAQERDGAKAELDRRAARDAALLWPRFLLRRRHLD